MIHIFIYILWKCPKSFQQYRHNIIKALNETIAAQLEHLSSAFEEIYVTIKHQFSGFINHSFPRVQSKTYVT